MSFKTVPLLLCDFYKTVHSEQYPKDVTKIVSYYTPRMTRIKDDKVVMFGLQAFIKEYLIDYFNDNFFNRPEDEIIKEYTRILDNTLGKGVYDTNKVRALHRLGYLPIEIKAIKEGSLVNIKVPLFEVSNTHPDFAWVTNALETLISCTMWHTMQSANVGYKYRQIVDEYYLYSVDDNVPRKKALGDFSLRGQESLESGIKSSAGWCLSFVNTATVPTIPFLEQYYNCNCEKDEVAYGAISTEHSVMCSNYAIDGDEVTMLRRLLHDIYPHSSFSMVSDSYDYWKLVNEILPRCKREILSHDGCLLIRGDSGDPIEIVTQTVFNLWDIFGGTINSKGYKVLDPHIKAIYGDSITPQRCEKIYQILTSNGFACNNVVLGVGSFSMQCLEENGVLQPYTRDTFGVAIKATYCETVDGKCIPIFKNPKTDTGHFKKSQKGCCIVLKDDNNKFSYIDEKSFSETNCAENQLKTVFKNGRMVREYSLQEIRNELYKGEF